ncbi:MAG: hypothetical protein KIG60_10125 [Caryophanon sp.]|nr:hypothetical protein [Caryophanon sp.]
MATLELYKVTNQPNELTKTLNNAVVVNGSFRSEIYSMDVIVEIEANTYDFNYVHIPSLNKYYFLQNLVHVNAKIIRMQLHCDVLMTYKTDILASYGLVIQGGTINPYYSSIESESRQAIRRTNFPYKFNDAGNFVLVTITNNALEG